MANFVLNPGQVLQRGVPLERGGARMWLQTDGNLVIYYNGKAVWASTTKGADRLHMQSDGNLVLFAGSKAVWQSHTSGHPGALLDLLPDGSAVIYTKVGGTGIWNSRMRPGKDGLPSTGTHLLPDPFKIFTGVTRTAKDLTHLKIQSAVKNLGSSVDQIAGAQIIQAGWPGVVPAAILNGAVTGGKQGALKAARSFLKNPVAKATYAAVGVILPPLAPVSAGMVAGMESASRLLDAIESKDPKKIAEASLSIASTEAQAAGGIPGAVRALDLIDKTKKAMSIVERIGAGDGAAIRGASDLAAQAKAGDSKAQAALHVLQAAQMRQGFKKTAPAAAKKVVKTALKEMPSLAAQVHAAYSSPTGVRIGNYSVLSTGRLLLKGKGLKHETRHKTKKAYDAYMKAHPHG